LWFWRFKVSEEYQRNFNNKESIVGYYMVPYEPEPMEKTYYLTDGKNRSVLGDSVESASKRLQEMYYATQSDLFKSESAKTAPAPQRKTVKITPKRQILPSHDMSPADRLVRWLEGRDSSEPVSIDCLAYDVMGTYPITLLYHCKDLIAQGILGLIKSLGDPDYKGSIYLIRDNEPPPKIEVRERICKKPRMTKKRKKLLEILRAGFSKVSEIAEHLGINRKLISGMLRRMREVGLVKWVKYGCYEPA
jgi:hypothetical protein